METNNNFGRVFFSNKFFIAYSPLCVQEVKQITTKEHREEAVYDILEYIEGEKSNKIRTFWTCVASEVILKRYPTLKKLYDQLTDSKTYLWTLCFVFFCGPQNTEAIKYLKHWQILASAIFIEPICLFLK